MNKNKYLCIDRVHLFKFINYYNLLMRKTFNYISSEIVFVGIKIGNHY